MKKISVIIPVYNACAYLRGSVESVLTQSDCNWELLLVDDASADGSAELCDELAAADSRIRVIHAAHGGAAAARNRGVEEACGELIAFIDSDDVVEAEYLTYLRGLMESYGAEVAVCGHDTPRGSASVAPSGALRYRGPSCCDTSTTWEGKRYTGDEALEALLYQRHFMSVPWGMLSKKTLWENVRFPEGTEAEDMGTIYRLFMEANSVVWGGSKLYHYVQHGSNTIFTTKVSRNIAYFRHGREMIENVRRQRPQCMKAALSRHFSICAQALSETALHTQDKFVKRLYADLKKMAPVVMKDKNARSINRGAACVVIINPSLLHFLLRVFYNLKLL